MYAAAFFNGRFKAGASQSDAVAETKDFVRAALRLVQQQPYWARRGGSDHVFVFAQDFGRCNLAPPEVGPAIAIQINGDPLPGDGAWGGAQGDFDEPPDPSYDAPSAAAAELRARGEAGAARCFEAGRDIVVPPLVEPPDALLPALLASNASLLVAETNTVAPYWSAASAAAAASCDCTWAQPAGACDGGDDGTPCWRGCSCSNPNPEPEPEPEPDPNPRPRPSPSPNPDPNPNPKARLLHRARALPRRRRAPRPLVQLRRAPAAVEPLQGAHWYMLGMVHAHACNVAAQ